MVSENTVRGKTFVAWNKYRTNKRTKQLKVWHTVLYALNVRSDTEIKPHFHLIRYASTRKISRVLSMNPGMVYRILEMCRQRGWVEKAKTNKTYWDGGWSFKSQWYCDVLRGRPKAMWRFTKKGRRYWRRQTNLFDVLGKIFKPIYL